MQQSLHQTQYFKNRIFSIGSERDFEKLALELFYYQAEVNPVYQAYLKNLSVEPTAIESLHDIPFLPISFFKSHKVVAGKAEFSQIFTSSGTSGSTPSKHYVRDAGLYEESFRRAFRLFYGPVEEYCVLALLPSYLEREGSSLVYMANRMIELSQDEDSGFYLDELDRLFTLLLKKIKAGKKVLLLGVTFGLLDLAENYELPFNDMVIMETGGMKGRRKEMLRTEVHEILKSALGVNTIHSEYGMTELLSQAYSKEDGHFETPPWMKVMIRETDDPFSWARLGKTGGINMIDLANVDSCAFIETQDLGRLHSDGTFEVMGRFDNADIRGCNLMVI